MHKLAVVVILFFSAGSASADKPTLTFGAATIDGDGVLELKDVSTAIERSSSKLLACYKKALAKSAVLHGTATARFTIAGDGKVTAATTQGLNKEVEACISATISKLKFAKPADGKPVTVLYPMMFESGTQLGAFASLTGTGDISSISGGFDDTNIYGGLLGNEAGEMGKSGFGPGGGGTGWGTIGTGRYGTIGQGSGGMRGRSSGVPTVSIGQPNATGNLDKAIIRRYVKRNIQKIQYCYEKELLTKTTLQGTATVAFTIGADGLVTASSASGMKDNEVETCVAGVIRTVEFPKPKGGGEVVVSYPFTFRPAETPAKKELPTAKPDPKLETPAAKPAAPATEPAPAKP